MRNLIWGVVVAFMVLTGLAGCTSPVPHETMPSLKIWTNQHSPNVNEQVAIYLMSRGIPNTLQGLSFTTNLGKVDLAPHSSKPGAPVAYFSSTQNGTAYITATVKVGDQTLSNSLVIAVGDISR